MLGEKIKMLRNCKQITQTELANALSVSSQTVSKWENHVTTPDISVLPVIARYFGITMDELFDYRIEPLYYKERFIRFMYENGMLRFGDFQLKSGRISPYLIHSGGYRMSNQIAKLGDFYATYLRNHTEEKACLVGLTCRDTALVVATSMVLYQRYGIDANYCVDACFEGFESNLPTVLVTDTCTSGTTLCQELDRIGRMPREIVVSVDRMERSKHGFITAKQEIEKRYGVKMHAIVTFDDIVSAVQQNVIPAKEYLQSLIEYGNQYRGI